ncbi:polysaccharide deacetylase family protein, partial [bacterium]|nr:polysaccharide deacetylase family protein [bacterium]
MKNSMIFIFALAGISGLTGNSLQARTNGGDIVLLVRADDIGSSHAANVACIESFRKGIARSVEIMVPCPWFPEAARMLAENPGLDVGVHLTLTSEWENMKWGPLTCAPSLVDPDGYFFPMVWENKEFPPKSSLKEAAWDISEVERELRAQIELAKKHIPWISHVSGHMAFERMHPALDSVVRKLEKEYGLETAFPEGMKGFRDFGKGRTVKEKIRNFVNALEALGPGMYMLVDHPGADGPEMRAIGHKG